MGKSSSGKDTIFRKLMQEGTLGLKTIVPYTTRPIRTGERDGVDYHYTDEEGFQILQAAGRIIEDRAYHTVHGLWRYFTVADDSIELDKYDYCVIGTLEAYVHIREYFGEQRVLPIYIEIDDGERLQRALSRERLQKEPKYEELCRRFLADCQDFSEEKLQAAGIAVRFQNEDLDSCLKQIAQYIDNCRVSNH